MSRYGRIGRRDENEPEIVRVLAQIGASVLRLHDCDLLVGYRGKNILIELKDGAKPPSARKLTDKQLIFRAEWRGQYDVAHSIDDVLHILTRLTT